MLISSSPNCPATRATAPYDLIIHAGRVVCAASGLDGPGAVAVTAGRIVAAGLDVTGPAREELSFPDGILLPGLVDFHAHPDVTGSRFGVDADRSLLPFGATTIMSQGDAGAFNWRRWEEAASVTSTRLMLALNLGRRGEATTGGCFEDLALADIAECVAAVETGGDRIWGIAVNTSVLTCGATDPREILRRGLAAAEATGKPLLFGSRRAPDWPLAEQLPLLRAGDVVTYCFSPDPDGLLDGDRVRDAVWEARERGVLFDLGHGMGSFSFRVAEAAGRRGFFPDTLSTDFYRRHLGAAPPHHLPRVLSKLLACGMAEREAFARVTHRPAALLGLAAEVGSLTPGSCADLAVLRWNREASPLRDTLGETRPGGCWEPVLTVRGGRLIPAPEG
jgi:dihydroorotase